jgi:hypothetical protein
MTLMGHKDLKNNDALHQGRSASKRGTARAFGPQIGHK